MKSGSEDKQKYEENYENTKYAQNLREERAKPDIKFRYTLQNEFE